MRKRYRAIPAGAAIWQDPTPSAARGEQTGRLNSPPITGALAALLAAALVASCATSRTSQAGPTGSASATTGTRSRGCEPQSWRGGGLSPTQIRSHYGLDDLMIDGAPGDGRGQKIAIIMRGSDPAMAPTADPGWPDSPLVAFSCRFGIPTDGFGLEWMTTTGIADPGALRRLMPDPDNEELHLDVQWAHAIAPAADLLVIAPPSLALGDVAQAVDLAAQHGATVVSMSFGSAPTPDDLSHAGVFDRPGISFVAGVGNRGGGAQRAPEGTRQVTPWLPAGFPTAVAVGGTHLARRDGQWHETAWGAGQDSYTRGGTSGGPVPGIPRPGTQSPAIDNDRLAAWPETTSLRLTPDLSLMASPGVPIVATNTNQGLTTTGPHKGTSVATALFAGMVAILNQARHAHSQRPLNSAELVSCIYRAPDDAFVDIVEGDTGYPATPGYDLATGRGSPKLNDLIATCAPDSHQSGIDTTATTHTTGTT